MLLIFQQIVRYGSQRCLSGEEVQMAFLAVTKHILLSMMFVFVIFIDQQIYAVLEDIADTGTPERNHLTFLYNVTCIEEYSVFRNILY